MRVTIEHREESSGLTGSAKQHYVDCMVEFSEEEKAIIKARDLKNTNFTVPSASPLPTQSAYWGSAILNTLGRIGVFVGLPFCLITAFTKTPGLSALANFMFFGGAILWFGAALAGRRQNRTIENREQVIRVGGLLSQGRFTCHAANPAYAKTIEEEIKSNLSMVKQLIQESAELKVKQTFEL